MSVLCINNEKVSYTNLDPIPSFNKNLVIGSTDDDFRNAESVLHNKINQSNFFKFKQTVTPYPIRNI